MNDQLLTAIVDEARMRMIAAGTDVRLANPGGQFSGTKIAEAEAVGAVAGALRVLHNEGYRLLDDGGIWSSFEQLADELEGRIS